MLWSLFKIILFVTAIALLTLGAGYLLETDGGIRIAVGSMEFNLEPLQAVIAGVLLVVAIWLAIILLGLIIAFVRFVNGDETAISRYFDRSRERKGYEALAEGMIALASGEGSTAMSKASRAEKYLRRPELTNLLTAQAAEMSGDKRKADEVYKRLLKDERTQFVGVRGIMKHKLAEGDTETAMKLAQKAFALKPRHTETQDVLLGLQARHNDWSGARKTLGAKLKYGALPRDVHRRRDAVLALSEAKGVLHEGNDIKAREAAIEANRLSPDLVPAAVMAARTYIENGKARYATRVLVKAWSAQPHPDIAAAFAEIAPEESAIERLKRFRALTKHRDGDPETRMLLTELNIAAEDYSEARKALGDLPDVLPSQRALTLLAAIERGEGADDQTVRALLARAVTAPRGPQWVCENCNHVHAAWAPVCDGCKGFDTLAWKSAPETDNAMQGGAEMLPMIVGEANSAEEVVEISDPDIESADDVPDAEIIEADRDAAQDDDPQKP
ncbi:heme biosynthesis protein HemY [Aliiroseovarius sp. M344]|uniref:heme biosynthesis protein HemY n=1 Tax=Aliiroseovarius sp. M344 TaxID=2867010 RepID=UPI0021AD76B6|nr:heme biosynthesis HemY N-terminal domain-containing protein [Aliiroseovarius sp. M344]UWQ14324.1 heme biosynthesis protein HemY [Aliiroseovarius sp. M344]